MRATSSSSSSFLQPLDWGAAAVGANVDCGLDSKLKSGARFNVTRIRSETFWFKLIIPLLVFAIKQQLSELLISPALAATSTQDPSSSSSSSFKSNQTSAPLWQRPGCYQVGHTRTISIPGCVKFNLSTNACRGYCVSFSIPAAEDIGPPRQTQLTPEQLEGFLSSGSPVGGSIITNIGGQQLPLLDPPDLSQHQHHASELQQQQQQQQNDQFRMKKWPQSGNYDSTTNTNINTNKMGAPLRANMTLQLQDLTVGQESPLSGTIGDTSVKRDVISVGQCCNMMETEDVIVNLRCGLNETRKLVFKSAKTCECFFCKHV